MQRVIIENLRASTPIAIRYSPPPLLYNRLNEKNHRPYVVPQVYSGTAAIIFRLAAGQFKHSQHVQHNVGKNTNTWPVGKKT